MGGGLLHELPRLPDVPNGYRAMPAIVDHEERRRHIAEITAAIIAEEGLDFATIRHVSAKSGYSTSVVTHYFTGKRELLTWAHRVAAEQAQARVDAALAADPADLPACVASLMPTDERSTQSWRVFLAFRQMATIDPEFADAERWWFAHARDIVAGVAQRCYAPDRITPDAIEMLMAVMQGVSVQVVFDAESWPVERQRALVEAQIAMLFGSRAT